MVERDDLALSLTKRLSGFTHFVILSRPGLEGVAKGARAPLHAQSLQAVLALCQTQVVVELPSRAFKHLVKLPDLPSHLADLCRGYRADALTLPLVKVGSGGCCSPRHRVLFSPRNEG